MSNVLLAVIAASILALGSTSAVADVSAMVREGKRLRVQGKTADAVEVLKRALREEPNHYLATYNLGLTYWQEGKRDEAIRTLRSAAALREKTGGTDYTIYNTLGWAYLQQGDTASAESQFMVGLKYKDKLSPVSRARLENNLGTLYFSKGEVDRAEPLFRRSAAAGNELAKENLDMLTTVKTNVQSWQVREARKVVPPTQ